MLKSEFLGESICYFCGDPIYNYELVTLFDGREVRACFECFTTVELSMMQFFCKLGEIEIPWEGDYEKE